MATQRYDVEEFSLPVGGEPVEVLIFNTATLNYAEIAVYGNVLRMSDDCVHGILIRSGQHYIITPSDYTRADPRGEEVVIKMKCYGETPAVVSVSKSYRVEGGA